MKKLIMTVNILTILNLKAMLPNSILFDNFKTFSYRQKDINIDNSDYRKLKFNEIKILDKIADLRKKGINIYCTLEYLSTIRRKIGEKLLKLTIQKSGIHLPCFNDFKIFYSELVELIANTEKSHKQTVNRAKKINIKLFDYSSEEIVEFENKIDEFINLFTNTENKVNKYKSASNKVYSKIICMFNYFPNIYRHENIKSNNEIIYINTLINTIYAIDSVKFSKTMDHLSTTNIFNNLQQKLMNMYNIFINFINTYDTIKIKMKYLKIDEDNESIKKYRITNYLFKIKKESHAIKIFQINLWLKNEPHNSQNLAELKKSIGEIITNLQEIENDLSTFCTRYNLIHNSLVNF